MPIQQLKESWTDIVGATVSYVVSQTGAVAASIGDTIVGGTSNKPYLIAITKSTLQMWFLVSSQNATANVGGADSVQTITMSSGGSGDTIIFTFGGQSTPAQPYNTDGPTISAAFTALSSVGAGNAIVTGPNGGPWRFEFTGALGLAPQAAITWTIATTHGASAAIVQTVTGVAPTQTMTLIAGVPWCPWHKDSAYANPLSGDIAKLSFTVPGTASAQISLESLYN